RDPIHNGEKLGDHFCVRAFLQGSFRFETPSGTNLLPRGRKVRALLAYLCLADKGGASRARLSGLLWNSSTDKGARSSLRQALSELRAKLDRACPGLLTSEREYVQLDVKRCWIDVNELMQLGDAQSATPVATPFELLEDLRGLSEAFDEWLELE